MKNYMQLLLKLGAVLLTFSLLAACSTTPEAQQQRYKKNIDQLELKANKLPQAKADIQKKVAEFNADFEKAGADIEALRGLNSRVEKYIEEVDKMTMPPAKSVPGSKIGTTSTTTTGVPPTGMAPAGGKLGGTGMPAGTMPTGMPAQPGGKLGGAPMTPPVGTPPVGTPPVGTAPANNGGFGGK